MKRCSQCNDAESVIELTQIVGGEVKKIPLCAKCAAEKGIQTPGAYADTPLGSLLAALGGEPIVPEAPSARPDACPGCGATLDDFRQSGRLGCEQCYTTFAEPLADLLRRLHGSVHHAGKVSSGVEPTTASTDESLPVLRERLRQAVAAEQFELAAKLRDQLKGRQ